MPFYEKKKGSFRTLALLIQPQDKKQCDNSCVRFLSFFHVTHTQTIYETALLCMLPHTKKCGKKYTLYKTLVAARHHCGTLRKSQSVVWFVVYAQMFYVIIKHNVQ